MDILSKILEQYPDEGYVKAEGFDAAIIGVSTTNRFVYSIDSIIEILMKRNGWSHEDATFYFFDILKDSYNGKIIFINLIN
jgi:thiamine monophosphate kinase